MKGSLTLAEYSRTVSSIAGAFLVKSGRPTFGSAQSQKSKLFLLGLTCFFTSHYFPVLYGQKTQLQRNRSRTWRRVISNLVGSGRPKMRSGPKRLSMISNSSRVRFEMGMGADNSLQQSLENIQCSNSVDSITIDHQNDSTFASLLIFLELWKNIWKIRFFFYFNWKLL